MAATKTKPVKKAAPRKAPTKPAKATPRKPAARKAPAKKAPAAKRAKAKKADAPAPTVETGPVSFALPLDEFMSVVHNAVIAASTDSMRPPLTAVCFDVAGDGWTVSTTDSYRMIVQTGTFPEPVVLPWRRLASARLLKRAAAAAKSSRSAVTYRDLMRGKSVRSDKPVEPPMVRLAWPTPERCFAAIGDETFDVSIGDKYEYPDYQTILDGLDPDAPFAVAAVSGPETPEEHAKRVAAAEAAHDRTGKMFARPVAFNPKFLADMTRLHDLARPGVKADNMNIRVIVPRDALKPARFEVGKRVVGGLMPVRTA